MCSDQEEDVNMDLNMPYRKADRVTGLGLNGLVILALCWCAWAPLPSTATNLEPSHGQLLPADRVLIGTVEEVRSDQARVDTGELQPRFIPMGVRKEKGLPAFTQGDRVEITVNEQNVPVDVHKAGESSHHEVVQGQLVAHVETRHDKAVIRTTDGAQESHGIRPVARSKVASVPVGVDAVFLIDERDRIADVIYGNLEAVHRAGEPWKKKIPLKGK
ncbi:MAG: hypothetical protein DYH03_12410 [Nitrospira sp. NTP1]|nr:hypothetical protein [Nitrospira sp. NTP1]